MKNITKTILFLLVIVVFSTNFAQAQDDTAKLNNRQKSIIPIAAFTAMGNLQKLEKALNAGLDAGLTINEIKEMLIHSYAYVGFPRSLNGIILLIML